MSLRSVEPHRLTRLKLSRQSLDDLKREAKSQGIIINSEDDNQSLSTKLHLVVNPPIYRTEPFVSMGVKLPEPQNVPVELTRITSIFLRNNFTVSELVKIASLQGIDIKPTKENANVKDDTIEQLMDGILEFNDGRFILPYN